MSQPIRITPEDINSPEVDEFLRQRDAVFRAREHYDEQSSTGGGGFRWSQLLYNSLVYMSLFGLGSGVVAAVVGEGLIWVGKGPGEEYWQYAGQLDAIDRRLERGELSESMADAERERLYQRYRHNPLVRQEYEDLADDQIAEEVVRGSIRGGVFHLIWYTWLGIILGFTLAVGDQAVSQNWTGVIVNGSVGIVLGLFGGLVGMCLANFIYGAMAGGDVTTPIIQQVLARAIGWGTFGIFLAVAPGVVLRNGKRLVIGLAGGLIGGIMGGLVFDVVATAVSYSGFTGDAALPSRCISLAAIGLVTGLGTGLIEAAAKSGWLKVVAGLIAGKQFILYKNPTYIGSSPTCEIYLFKDTAVSPRHAALHRAPAGYVLEDLGSATGTLVGGKEIAKTRLRAGDYIKIGSTVFQFQERGRK